MMARLGQILSAAGHLGLILGMVFVDIWDRHDTEPAITVSEVSLITDAQLQALQNPKPPPPSPEPSAPETTQIPPKKPSPEPSPEPPPPPPPELEVEVEAEVSPTTAPPIDPALRLPVSETLSPKIAERVAPVVVEAEPPEDVAEQNNENPPLTPVPTPTETPPKPEEPLKTPSAPKEAGTVLKTEVNAREAEAPFGGAPDASLRPPRRPPEPAKERASIPPVDIDLTDAINEALQQALAQDAPTLDTSGAQQTAQEQLTGSEITALHEAMSGCWKIGTLSSEALNVTVTVAFSLNRRAEPLTHTIVLKSYTGGGESAAQSAFAAARRAIIECGTRGLPLPPEKYAQWRDLEFSFNPREMRRR